MKNNVLIILFLAVLASGIVSCKDKAKEAVTTEAEAPTQSDETANSVSYLANSETSSIEWIGSKPTGTHFGTINIESGTLQMAKGNIVSGTFTIDMTSIVVKDIPSDDKKNGKLLKHLKSPDFFDVENHPTATFTITGAENVDGKTMLSGNLAIKEIENNITFPITVTNHDTGAVLTSETFSIDRSKWDVKFGSKSFFDNLGDKFINDDIELKIIVQTTKS